MAWEQLSINKPHLAYLIIGGFTTLFMLCSLFIKEKLYIGEATIATICGIIFGPHAADLFSPQSWGNVDQITLETSRIVLVVQCFAVGVELPKSYMERHWRSVVFLLLPVMTFGWLITSLFIWWMVVPLTWLESLACAACVTATDPVLASSVVGKGKFAKRVPKHLRDLLSAESGCNDGMAFPFIYLSIYLLRYRPDASAVAYHWFCFTILYECIFGAVYGFTVGYIGRHAIKWAEDKGIIDRESFLVFYFVLALFCAGSGSLLGMDDLLIGFACGVGFSNDGWFTQKTEESHVSNVIDLLLNLAYFVYLGAIIPWGQYNAPQIGLTPWRLVVIAILVVFFRRIPIMLALKPLIPDIKNWREALFAGHFGPIGVGAIFAAILTRAELETESTTPLAELPGPDTSEYLLVQVIWPITTFLVITSIIVHGSSVAVFTLGKRINTLQLTLSYTQANEDGTSWMNRLPRIQTSRSQSKMKGEDISIDSSDEKVSEYAPGTLPPIGLPGNFLRRQKEEDNPSSPTSRTSSARPLARRRKWDSGMGPGGPISESAIAPRRRKNATSPEDSVIDERSSESPTSSDDIEEPPDQLEMEDAADKRKEKQRQQSSKVDEPAVEAYQEGDEMIIEDEEGNVLSQEDINGEGEEQKQQHIHDAEQILRHDSSGQFAKDRHHPHANNEGEDIEHAIGSGLTHPAKTSRNLMKRMGTWQGFGHQPADASHAKPVPIPEHKRGPAHAYQYGNTIIIEDEDGEVIKKYDVPGNRKKTEGPVTRQRLLHRPTWHGIGHRNHTAETTQAGDVSGERKEPESSARLNAALDKHDDDDGVRFIVKSGGQRLTKADFIKQIRQLDPKARCEAVEESDMPEHLKHKARQDAKEHHQQLGRDSAKRQPSSKPDIITKAYAAEPGPESAEIQRVAAHEDRPKGDEGLTLVDSNGEDVPLHDISETLAKFQGGAAVERRRRLARKDSDDDGTDRVPPSRGQAESAVIQSRGRARDHSTPQRLDVATGSAVETQAERKRRMAALGQDRQGKDDSDSEDDGGERKPVRGHEPVSEPSTPSGVGLRTPGIRFAETPATSQGRVQWGEDVGKKRSKR